MSYLKKKRLVLMKSKTFRGYMKTVSGYPLTLSNCMENGLINLKISGNSVQNGTPTPQNPIEVQSVGDYDETTQKYKITIKINDEDSAIIYLDEPLRKCGDVADYIDYKNRKVIRNIYKYNFAGTEKFYFTPGATANGFFQQRCALQPLIATGSAQYGYGNFLPNLRQYWNKWTDETLHFGQNNGVLYVITREQFTTDTEVYNYLSNNGTNDIYVIYILREPFEEDIDREQIIIDKGSNVITADTQLLPSNMEAEYYSYKEE
jgi:hypothetical protein